MRKVYICPWLLEGSLTKKCYFMNFFEPELLKHKTKFILTIWPNMTNYRLYVRNIVIVSSGWKIVQKCFLSFPWMLWFSKKFPWLLQIFPWFSRGNLSVVNPGYSYSSKQMKQVEFSLHWNLQATGSTAPKIRICGDKFYLLP